jgi:hypothetical protein
MDNILYAIVVHDIKIINYFEKIKKYNFLENYKYLLVGNHDVDYTNEYIIQCNKLKDNIENNNYYLAFTGWYALAKNIKLIPEKFEHIFLLEYDMTLDKEETSKTIHNLLPNEYEIYGLSTMSIEECLHPSIFSNLLISFLKQQKIKEIKCNNKVCIATNNILVSKNFLINLFDNKLTLDFLNFLKNDKMSGHNLERYISTYCFLNNIKYEFLDSKGFGHGSLDSHNTQNKHQEYLNYLNIINTN